MGYWIATVLRDERERAGITIDQLATATGVNWRTIKRLEERGGFAKGKHGDIDDFVARYAYVLGVDDARDLWDQSLVRWRRDGSPPQFEPIERPEAAFGEALRMEALRRRAPRTPKGHPGQSGRRRATQ